jgi:hypothetical protein
LEQWTGRFVTNAPPSDSTAKSRKVQCQIVRFEEKDLPREPKSWREKQKDLAIKKAEEMWGE